MVWDHTLDASKLSDLIQPLFDHLGALKGFVEEGELMVEHGVLALESSLNDLKHKLEDLSVNATDDAVAALHSVNAILKTRLHALGDQADSATETVVHASKAAFTALYEAGHDATILVEDLIAETGAVLSAEDDHKVAKWPVYVYFASAMICLLFSAIFHLFGCISEEWWAVLAPLDYTGISLLIAGSSIPVIYYGYFCSPTWFYTHLIVCSLVNISCVFVNLMPQFRTSHFRTTRAMMFVASGTFGILPMFQLLILHGGDEFHLWLLVQLAGMGLMYVFGAFLYAARLPERFFPGYFDTLGSSHQLFHVLVVLAALVHVSTVCTHYKWRSETVCSA